MGALAYLARRFVAGENMADALIAVHALNSKGVAASLDLLGEDVSSKEDALIAQKAYLELLHQINAKNAKSNVSLKLTQMGLDVDEEFCYATVKAIVEEAGSYKNFVRLDMEGSAYTARTISMFMRLFKDHKNVGAVLQAYLHRSENDAKALAAIKAPVRVCKGAYKESSSIAFMSMNDIRNSYKSMVQILIEGGSKVAIATHDEKLITWALDWTQDNHIPKDQFEFQFLYGLKRSRAKDLASQGYQVRTYIPFGTHWMPYFFRRLRERKENVFFVLKGLFED
ncbi:MAG: proline dehydrogenase family protein [Bdellovibrionales bacterium]|nr:proline dehydrogenase family protein [Bdellovibrionales bacterium]